MSVLDGLCRIKNKSQKVSFDYSVLGDLIWFYHPDQKQTNSFGCPCIVWGEHILETEKNQIASSPNNMLIN